MMANESKKNSGKISYKGYVFFYCIFHPKSMSLTLNHGGMKAAYAIDFLIPPKKRHSVRQAIINHLNKNPELIECF
jgi:hypothetical protein